MTEEFNIEISNAIADGDMDAVAALLNSIPDAELNTDIIMYVTSEEDDDLVIKENVRPLHLAVVCGLVQVTAALISKGATVNNIIDSGENQYQTLLTIAVDNNDVAMVTLLLEKGANPNIVPTEGEHKGKSPLWLAAYLQNVAIIKLLLEHNANPNIAPTEGRNANTTPLWLASNSGLVESVKLLLEKKANVDTAPTETAIKGKTPLFMAIGNENVEIAQLLVANKANVNIPDAEGVTPVMMATSRGNFTLAELLVKTHHVKIGNLNSENWKLALKNAATRGATKCIAFIKNAAIAESGLPLLFPKDKHLGFSKMVSDDVFKLALETLTGNKRQDPPKNHQKPT